jgi:hypothetical protein
MSKVRQHYEYAKTGDPSQDCDLELGPKVPKTDWGAGTRDGGESDTPHREEKESDRE